MKVRPPNSKGISYKSVKNIESDVWPVYGNYCAVGPAGVVKWTGVDEHEVIQKVEKEVIRPKEDRDTYVMALGSIEDTQHRAVSGVEHFTLYGPLSMPELFLDFAELADKKVTLEVMLNWVGRYGVLGLGGAKGGSEESLRSFASEAEKANSVLRLYEVVTEPEGPRPIQFHELTNYVIARPTVNGKLRLKASATPEEQRDTVLGWVTATVNEMVARECYPTLYGQGDEYRQGWGFKSLLGAMYLQMMQLMTSDEVRRCKGPDCWRIIAFEPGEPYMGPGLQKNLRGKYKTRIDKEFCSPNCRVKWHYHSVIKPRREKERSQS
jgi:hypothetical protein